LDKIHFVICHEVLTLCKASEYSLNKNYIGRVKWEWMELADRKMNHKKAETMNPSTLLDLVDEGFGKNTTGVAASTKREGVWQTTDICEFREKVRYFALGLYELGVRPGDKVALHSESCTEWLWIDQAILSIGAASVPIYTTQPGDQIEFILENSEAKAYVFSRDKLFDSVKPLIKNIKTVKAVIAFLPSVHEKVKPVNLVIEKGRERDAKDPGLFDKLRSDITNDQLATLIYTSGTTGRPKGVMLSHHNLVANIKSTVLHIPFDIELMRGSRMLSYLPLSHVLERMGTFMYMYMGYPIYFIEDIQKFADELKEVDPVFFITVPRLLEKIHMAVRAKGEELSGVKKKLFFWAIDLAEHYDVDNPPSGYEAFKYRIADKIVYAKIREAFGDNLIGIISGGAALSPLISRFFTALGYFCNQGYGLTETSPVLTLNDLVRHKLGSAGYPLEGVELRIADDGEILAKGPNIMKGYYKLPKETTETISDGWLHTGDMGRIDEDGFLFITDRKKALFKLSTGKYVAPQPIENTLGDSPYIEQVVVIGNEKKFCSALIVPNFPAVKSKLKNLASLNDEHLAREQSVKELIQDVVDENNKQFAIWEQVKKFVLLSEPLTIETGELTPTLKVKRKEVQKTRKKEIEEIYPPGDE